MLDRTRSDDSRSANDQRVGPDVPTAALVVCCIAGLVLVAGVIPAVENLEHDALESASTPTDVEAPNDGSGSGTVGNGTPDTSTRNESPGLDEPPTLEFRDVTPGDEMTVQVLADDEPVSAAAVTVDGATVGVTDENGIVEHSVPYEDQITVAASRNDWRVSETHDLTTQIAVSPRVVDGENETVEVVADIDGTPVRRGEVRVDGEYAGTTGDDGVVAMPLSDDGMTATIDRGAASGDVEIAGDDRTIAAGNWFRVPLVPGGPAEPTVTVDGIPVEDATVTVDGEYAGATGTDGSARISLPLADQAEIAADAAGRTVTTEVEGLAFRLAWGTLATLSLVLGVTITYVRLVDIETRRRHLQIALNLRLSRLLIAPFAALRRLVRVIPASSVSSLPSPRWLLGTVRGFVDSLRWLSQFARTLRLPDFSGLSLLALVPSFAWRSRRLDDEPQSSGRAEAAGGDYRVTVPDDESPVEPERLSIRETWHELVDRLGVRQRETLTPGQIARRATEAGYPRDAVRRLTATFRDVEYGDREPTGERVSAANDAIERIRSWIGDDQ